MKNRYKISPSVQIKYLHTLEKQSGLSSQQLASLFNVVGRSYRDWRRGKYYLPVNAVEIIEKKFHIPFPEDKNVAHMSWIHHKKKMAQKGARALIKKYGSPGTPEGRHLGGMHGIQTLRRLGKVPLAKPFLQPKPSVQLAEFVGIMLGDGHVGNEQWSITLNSIKDKEYAIYCSDLIYSLFHFKPNIFHRKTENVLVIESGGKKFITYLRSLGLTATNKVKEQIGVPQWIIKNLDYRIACLRGLMDTDGGIFTHVYVVNNKTYRYKKICFSNRSVPLLHFSYDTLAICGLTPKIIEHVENKKVWLYNQAEVALYLNKVNTHNQRLVRAYQEGCQSGNGAAC